MKFNTATFVSVFVVCCSLFFAAPSFAFADERIDTFTTHIQLNKNGSADVQEEIVFDFGTDQRHGIYREIPLIYTPSGSTKEARIQISSVAVSDGHGKLRQTAYQGNGNTVKLTIGDADTLVTGPQLYVIHYTVWGAFVDHLDRDEFYWNVTGDRWRESIGHVRAEIVLPVPLPKESVPAYCYTGEIGRAHV